MNIAKKYGIRIIGPNCIGIFNGETRIDTFFHPRERMVRHQLGPVSFITQSGTFGCTMLEWLAESEIGLANSLVMGMDSMLMKRI